MTRLPVGSVVCAAVDLYATRNGCPIWDDRIPCGTRGDIVGYQKSADQDVVYIVKFRDGRLKENCVPTSLRLVSPLVLLAEVSEEEFDEDR